MSIKTVFSRLGTFLDSTFVFLRRAALVVILIIIIGAIVGGLTGSKVDIPEDAILVLDIDGPIVEELSQTEFERTLGQLTNSAVPEVLLSDLIAIIESAKNDERIKYLLLDLEHFGGGNPSKLQAVARALKDFKTSEKKIIAYSGLGYWTSSYYLAAHADEIHMHDYSALLIEGYRSFRTYYKSFFDKFYIDSNVFKVGEYKAFVEPYFRDDMSEEAKNNVIEWISVLWSIYLDDVSKAKDIDSVKFKNYIDFPVEALKLSNGDLAKAALEAGLVDKLSNKREFHDYLVSLSGDAEDDSINSITMNEYKQAIDLNSNSYSDGLKESNIALIIASGSIIDGSSGPATIAGDDFVKLIRKAYRDESVKALVLRVDSGGGSAYASEVIADELEKFKQSGRPIVASMSSVAASGGYYISAPADKIFANPTTITGSIGVGGFIPTFERALDQIGIHEDGYSTVDLTTSPFQTLTEKDKEIIQMSVDDIYVKFITKVAEGRSMSVEEVDAIARGRVWIGEKALEIGLIDELGDLEDAILAAGNLAELDEDDYGVKLIEREMDFEFDFGFSIMTKIISFLDFIGFSITSDSLPPIIKTFEQQSNLLNDFNDPRGMYYYCFCSVE